MRFRKIDGLDYKRGAVEYSNRLGPSDRHHLLTKPFYNLAYKHARWSGEGLDTDTHRHFCDFANMAVALALPPGSRILDLGCGSGWLCEYFARLGYQVTGIDISPALVAVARERLSKVPYGLDHEKILNYRFLVHDVEAEPLKEAFEAIICYDSLHHFEDERAVLKNVAAMLDYGGQLFVLEGEQPPEGSETEVELRNAMRLNGLFDRETLNGDRLLPIETPAFNYLLCKKVSLKGGEILDSRNPGELRARFTLRGELPSIVVPGAAINLPIEIENAGDTLWLVSRAAPKGTVRLGVKILDEMNEIIDETHGSPPLPRAVAPGERVQLNVNHPAPDSPGRYTLKIDLVCQDICWFEQQDSEPLVLAFEVVSAVLE